MFRDLTRKNNLLSFNECVEILIFEKRGVLSVIGDNDYPYGMPMNHYYNSDDECIYFHCGKAGHRIDSLKRCNKVSFCVFDLGRKSTSDWALDIRSVVVFGRIDIIIDREIVSEITRKLSLKFTNNEKYIDDEIKAHIKNTVLLKLTPEHICGKLVHEA